MSEFEVINPAARSRPGTCCIVIRTPDQRVRVFVSSTLGELAAERRAVTAAVTQLATDSGGWRQINRAGHPMMWPIFWPDDTDFSNPANTRHPSKDTADDGEHIAGLVAAVAAASGTVGDPRGYGQAVAAELLPDLLPYVIGTPATYGFAVRNGRPLADNAPEVMLSLVTGTAIPSVLKPAATGHLRTAVFPYVLPGQRAR